MSKGSKRRPQQISDKEMRNNWDNIFRDHNDSKLVDFDNKMWWLIFVFIIFLLLGYSDWSF